MRPYKGICVHKRNQRIKLFLVLVPVIPVVQFVFVLLRDLGDLRGEGGGEIAALRCSSQ